MSVTTATRTFEAVGPDSTGHVDVYVDGEPLLLALSAEELALLVARLSGAPESITAVATTDEDGHCVICGRDPLTPFRRIRTEAGIDRVVEGCVAAAHPADLDAWARASQDERRNGTPVGA